jgi:hypothetical protein
MILIEEKNLDDLIERYVKLLGTLGYIFSYFEDWEAVHQEASMEAETMYNDGEFDNDKKFFKEAVLKGVKEKMQ